MQVPDEIAGKKFRCPKCNGKIRVPAAPPPPPRPPIEFICPQCNTTMRLPGEAVGTKIRCTQCNRKVRVPTPAAPAIEFLCPQCQTTIRVPGEAAGSKQRCPQCNRKVRVPVPAPAAAGAAGSELSPEAAALAAAAADEDFAPVKPLRVNAALLLGSSLFIAVIIPVAIWQFWESQPKLEGTLAGEKLTDPELGPFRLDSSYLELSKKAAKKVFSNLEAEPVRATSRLMKMEFVGTPAGIDIVIRVPEKMEFYRVDPNADGFLMKFVNKEREKFGAVLNRDLSQSAPLFAKAVEGRGERNREIPGLAEFRNTVGLASLVRGFGYHVLAVIGKETFPCVHEDAEGRLYFTLPLETTEFEIAGREVTPNAPKDAPRFPGRYKVRVSQKPVTIKKEKVDLKEKTKKMLEQ